MSGDDSEGVCMRGKRRHRVTLAGELDISVAGEVREELQRAIDDHPGKPVEVDLREATFMDSTVLGVLAAAAKRATGQGGALRVVNPPDRIERVLRITGLDRLLLD